MRSRVWAEARSIRAAESLLEQIIIHLLKLEYAPAVDPRAGWRREVRLFRLDLAKRLRQAPSLRGKQDLDEIYADARAAILLEEDGVEPEVLPKTAPYDMPVLLDDRFWLGNRHRE
jgi:hypothetical protein